MAEGSADHLSARLVHSCGWYVLSARSYRNNRLRSQNLLNITRRAESVNRGGNRNGGSEATVLYGFAETLPTQAGEGGNEQSLIFVAHGHEAERLFLDDRIGPAEDLD